MLWSALEVGGSDQQLSQAFAQLAANLFLTYFNHDVCTDLDVSVALGLDSE